MQDGNLSVKFDGQAYGIIKRIDGIIGQIGGIKNLLDVHWHDSPPIVLFCEVVNNCPNARQRFDLIQFVTRSPSAALMAFTAQFMPTITGPTAWK
jgi:hypothetical protein